MGSVGNPQHEKESAPSRLRRLRLPLSLPFTGGLAGGWLFPLPPSHPEDPSVAPAVRALGTLSPHATSAGDAFSRMSAFAEKKGGEKKPLSRVLHC